MRLSSFLEKALRRLPKEAATRISRAIESLATEPRPHGCKNLETSENQYRIRVGVYRVLYQIEDRRLVVRIIDLGDRKDIYR